MPYFIYYAVMDALAFKNAMNAHLNVKDKANLRTSLFLTFVVASCINFTHYKVNLFLVLPLYTLVYYFSIEAINKEQDLIRESLPSELKILVPVVPILTQLMRGFTIALIIIITNYLY